MHARSRPSTLIAIGLVALACTACGRRGALQPPDAGAPVERSSGSAPASARALPQSVGLGNGTAAPDPDAVREGDEVATAATPAVGVDVPVKTTRGARRGYTIPKQPFILDPIL